jgi:hypothetical protein
MPCVEFQPTAKTVHALDRSTTVTGKQGVYRSQYKFVTMETYAVMYDEQYSWFA